MASGFAKLLTAFLRLFFRLLYHEFAWTYDGVAALVSVGSWKSWGQISLDYASGDRILEVGFGPGHLQATMQRQGWSSFGLDASPQMARLASRRLLRQKTPGRLVVGQAQHLPYPNAFFSGAVSTFPSEYIYHQDSLVELRRVIQPEGTLVIIPLAWITGKKFVHRFWHWIFRITYQAPPSSSPEMLEGLVYPFRNAGFDVSVKIVQLQASDVLLILARNPGKL